MLPVILTDKIGTWPSVPKTAKLKGCSLTALTGRPTARENRLKFRPLLATRRRPAHLDRPSGSRQPDCRRLAYDVPYSRGTTAAPCRQGRFAAHGWADNTVTIKGTLDNPSATGSFRLTSGSYAGYLYKNISADYRSIREPSICRTEIFRPIRLR